MISKRSLRSQFAVVALAGSKSKGGAFRRSKLMICMLAIVGDGFGLNLVMVVARGRIL